MIALQEPQNILSSPRMFCSFSISISTPKSTMYNAREDGPNIMGYESSCRMGLSC